MLSLRPDLFLSLKYLKRFYQNRPGFSWYDDIIYMTQRCGSERLNIVLIVLLVKGFNIPFTLSLSHFLLKQDTRCRLRRHAGDLSARPGIDQVCPDILASHRNIGAGIGFSDNYRYFRNSGLGIGVKKLGAFINHSALLHLLANQVSRGILKGDDRNIEGITESDKTCPLLSSLDINHPPEVF